MRTGNSKKPKKDLTDPDRELPLKKRTKPAGGTPAARKEVTAPEHAEKALRQSESILRSFFDSAGVMRGIVEVIAEDDILHIADNAVTASFIGLTPGTMKNKRGSELGEPPDVLRIWVGHYNESRKMKKPVTFEYRDTRREPAAWLLATVSYLGTPPGGNPRFAYVVLDISERKRAETALHEAQEMTSTILEGIADTFYSLDGNWRFTLVNPAAEKAPFGRPAPELLGNVIWDLYPALVGTPIQQHYLDAAKNRSLEHYEAQSPLNGRWYEVFMQGRFDGVDVYMRDITARKKAEEGLRAAEEKYRLIVSNAPAMIYEMDFDGSRFLSVNDPMCSMLGYTRDELMAMRPADLIDENSRALFTERIRRTLAGELVAESVEYHGHTKDGREMYVSARTSFVYHDGKPASAIVVATDITANRKADEARKADLDAMTHLQKMGTLFLHEDNIGPVLTEIVDTAIAITDADFGNIQFINPETSDLRIMAHRGFPDWWLEFWNTQGQGKGSCGTVLIRGERVIIEDMEEDPIFRGTPALDIQRRAGIRAGQSTPIMSREGKLLGIFSTHFKKPHRPDARQLRLLDLLALQAADIIERVRFDRALRESGERYRLLADTMLQGVVYQSADGTIISMNPAAEQILGKIPEEFLGETSVSVEHDTIHEDGSLFCGDEHPAMVALKTGKQVRQVVMGVFNPRRKEYRWISIDAVPLFRPGEERPFEVYTVFEDITRRRHAEEALRESGERLSLSLAASGQGTWDYDIRNDRITASARMEEIYGVPEGSIRSRKDTRGPVIEEDLPVIDNAIGQADPVTGTYRVQYRIRRATDNVIRWIDSQGLVIRDREGEPVRLVGVTTDITDYKESEEDLRQKQAEIQALFDNIPAGLVLFDAAPPYSVLVHNRFYQELFAEPFFSKGMAGLNLYEYAPDAERAGIVAAFDEVVKTLQPRHFLDFPYRANPAKESWFNWYLAPIILEGRAVSIVSMSLDVTDRHRAEDALRESESRLRRANELLDSVTKSSGVMIAAEDRDLRYTYFNKAYADEIRRVTGKDLAVGLCMSDLFSGLPDEQVNSERQWKKVLDGKSIRETISFDNDGSGRRTFDVIHTPIRDETGAIIGAGEVSFDVTRQIHIEEELRETSRYLENLIKYANAPIIVWDPEFRITRFNRAFERLTGLKAQDVIGKTPDILFPDKHRKGAMDLIRSATTGDRWEVVEIPILHKSGEIRTVLWNSATLYDDDGKTVIATIAQGQEITSRKEAEERMRIEKKRAEEALSLLNAALESTTEGIYVVNSDRRMTSYNQNFVALWGIPEEMLAARDDRRISRFMQEQVGEPAGFADRLEEISLHPERESYDMVTLRDGRIFERHSKPQRLGKGIIGRVWSYQDVTERRLAERNLVASLQEKETLIREIHHRVKNNLQIISGLLDMTRMRTTDSTTTAILTDMMMKIKTMAQIHTRLYESKQFDRINMGSQIRDQVTDMASIYGRTGTEIQSEIAVEDVYLPVDQAIPCALVVNEILSNAFKHAFRGRKQGNIRVSVTREADHVHIVVKDDGIGIPGDVDVYKTTSLGLKLIRSLVLQLNGSVNITSNLGTEVTVECPFRPGGK